MTAAKRAGAAWLAAGLFLAVLAGCGPKVSRILTAGGPADAVGGPRHARLYVVCDKARKLQIFDVRERTLTAETEVGEGPSRLFLTHDYQRLHVLCAGSREWFTFALPDLARLQVRALEITPAGWCEVPFQRRDYIAAPETDRLHPFAGPRPLLPLETGGQPVEVRFDPVQEQLWTADYASHTLSVLSVADGGLLRTVPVRKNPRRLVLDPPGRAAYVLCAGGEDDPGESYLQWVDMNYHRAGLSVTVGKQARELCLGPYARRAACTTREALVVVDLRTQETQRLETGPDPRGVDLSPDGRLAYVACRGDDSIWVYELPAAARE